MVSIILNACIWRGVWQWRRLDLDCGGGFAHDAEGSHPDDTARLSPTRLCHLPAGAGRKAGKQTHRSRPALHSPTASATARTAQTPEAQRSSMRTSWMRLAPSGLPGNCFQLASQSAGVQPTPRSFTEAAEVGEAHGAYHEYLFKLETQRGLYTPAARRIAVRRHGYGAVLRGLAAESMKPADPYNSVLLAAACGQGYN
jgi:hypothetical protein